MHNFLYKITHGIKHFYALIKCLKCLCTLNLKNWKEEINFISKVIMKVYLDGEKTHVDHDMVILWVGQ